MSHTAFFFSSRRRHTRFSRDWSSDVCSSDLHRLVAGSEPERSAPAEGPERAIDEARVLREEPLRAEPERLDHARAQVLDEHVDPSEVLDEPRHRAGGPQIEGDGALARVEIGRSTRLN